MSDGEQKPPGRQDAELEREIRAGRKYSLADAIGRIGGGDLLKGASPVTRKRQAALEIERYLERHLIDADGALEFVLLRRVAESAILLEMNYDQPLAALGLVVERILHSEERLRYFVREVDAEWGRMQHERPLFETAGRPADRDDPYTFASVRSKLSRLAEKPRGD